MNTHRFPSAPDEILRRLSSQVVPVDDPVHAEQRREQVVDALSRSIRETAERKRRSLRTRVVWGLGLAASLALSIGIASRIHQKWLDEGTLATTVADVRGAVVVTESGESRVLSHGGKISLRELGEIETAPEAQAEIRSPKSLVRLGPATKLSVPLANPIEERYRLALGRVEVLVDKNSHFARSVVVETPNAEVVVHGTVFTVDVASQARHSITEVGVTRGSVWVIVGGVQVAVLGPGQRWSSEPPAVAGPASKLILERLAPVESAASHETARVSAKEARLAEIKASTLAEQSHMFQEAIDARNRGDDTRAVELFTRLFARHPGYEEAEVQLFRAQKRLGRTVAAAAEARRYLAQHPQGFAREEARTLALSSAPLQSH